MEELAVRAKLTDFYFVVVLHLVIIGIICDPLLFFSNGVRVTSVPKKKTSPKRACV